jgi:hypothetical protein
MTNSVASGPLAAASVPTKLNSPAMAKVAADLFTTPRNKSNLARFAKREQSTNYEYENDEACA